MSTEPEADPLDESPVSPEPIVQWQPTRHRRGVHLSAGVASGGVVSASAALGALALGAFAIGALAIGALAIGRLTIGRVRLRDVEIDRLVVRKVTGLR